MKILFPPRPKGRISPNALGKYESSGQWVVQRKFNGTRNLIHVDCDGRVSMFSRHGDCHKQFSPTESIKKEIISLNLIKGKEYWIDSELLSFKTKSADYKNRIVLFDLLQADRYLYRKPNQLERLDMLDKICRSPKDLESGGLAKRVTENIFLAQTFDSDFCGEFKKFIDRDEIEGLVLRKKTSFLENKGLREYSVSWQIRCRKPNINYTF